MVAAYSMLNLAAVIESGLQIKLPPEIDQINSQFPGAVAKSVRISQFSMFCLSVQLEQQCIQRAPNCQS